MSPNRKSRVAANTKAIRAFHAMGCSLPRKSAHKDAYGTGMVDIEAHKRGVSPDLVRKARQFADPLTGYSRENLRCLCQQLDTIQSNQEESLSLFTRSHIVRLLSV